MLKRAYTYTPHAGVLKTGALTFHYLPEGRLQCYVGRTDPITGEFDRFWAHLDEWPIKIAARGEVRTHAHGLMKNEALLADLYDVVRDA